MLKVTNGTRDLPVKSSKRGGVQKEAVGSVGFFFRLSLQSRAVVPLSRDGATAVSLEMGTCWHDAGTAWMSLEISCLE